MKVASLTSLLIVALLVLVQEGSSVDGLGALNEEDFSALDELERSDDEEEEHIRVERSPGWRRRFRVRIRKPIRKIGRTVRKAAKKVAHGVRKVGQGIKKVARKVKAGVKKLASKTKAAIKKAARKVKEAVKRAKERAKSAVKKLKENIKKIAKAPKDLGKKLKDKLKSLIAKGEEEEEEEKEVVVEPEVTPTQPTVPTKPPCNIACQFLRACLKEAEFFKRSYCTFYTLRRQHQDFLIERNLNLTLGYIITDIMRESVHFYSTLAEVLLTAEPPIASDSREKISRDCAGGILMKCNANDVKDDLFKLKCLKPCSGFTGCEQSDKSLTLGVDKAAESYARAVNRTLKLFDE